MKFLLLIALLLAGCARGFAAEVLPLPMRAPDALSGTALLERIELVSIAEREKIVAEAILAGNVPAFLRTLCPVQVQARIGERDRTAQIHVTSDYLAVGSDDDYLLVPLRPHTAQRIADALDCVLPTARLVDVIYTVAPLKLPPLPLLPGPAMTTMRVMAEHSRSVGLQRWEALVAHPFGTLTAGHKKDVVLTPLLGGPAGVIIAEKGRAEPAREGSQRKAVAIYGWHRLDGSPIQPLYTGHTAEWVDYSHGIRLISQKAVIDGQPSRLAEALADPQASALLSGEGPIREPRY